jgi:snurportin-1
LTGSCLTRVTASLPPNTILDCIYDAASSLLWILDALEWAGLPLSGSTAEMRRFWRDAKVAELPPQVLGDPRDRRLLVAAAPASDNVREMIAAAASGAPLCVKVPVVRLTYPDVDPPAAEADEGMEMDDTAPTSSPVARPGVLEVPVDIDGALLYLREALYESGSSCLAGWLPLEGGALAAAAAQLLVEGETGMTT